VVSGNNRSIRFRHALVGFVCLAGSGKAARRKPGFFMWVALLNVSPLRQAQGMLFCLVGLVIFRSIVAV
jgi:hypothetical protein